MLSRWGSAHEKDEAAEIACRRRHAAEARHLSQQCQDAGQDWRPPNLGSEVNQH